MPHTLGPVRILLVEDSPEDAELLSEQLLEAGLLARFERVDAAAALREALLRFQPDIVLSDLSMPGFSGHDALEIVLELSPATPFIFVSGTIGEDVAVQALQQGASDYVLKHNLARLPAAVQGAIRVARSEAERERAEKEMLRSQRLECLALLAAGLSHDLRNVLQPLLIVPDLLAARSDDPKIRRLGEVISECGRRGHEMAESMLSFVRGTRTAHQPVAVASLFQAVQMLLQGSLPKQVQLRIEVDDDAPVIDVNYTEMQQALLNLCINAIQAMPDGGVLTLTAKREGANGAGAVCLRVSDTGIGMDPAVQAQLFTPFFTTKHEGTGLGLLSCKRIVESYGGRIDVRSAPGEGTCFELRLPLALETEEPASDEHAAEGRNQRILLVDSDGTRLSLLSNALISQGYDPVRAPDGAYALRLLQERMPELVILDSEIVLLSAVSLLWALSEQGYAGPVIALENPSRPLDRRDLPPGMSLHVLAKPVQMHTLFQAVERALQAEG